MKLCSLKTVYTCTTSIFYFMPLNLKTLSKSFLETSDQHVFLIMLHCFQNPPFVTQICVTQICNSDLYLAWPSYIFDKLWYAVFFPHAHWIPKKSRTQRQYIDPNKQNGDPPMQDRSLTCWSWRPLCPGQYLRYTDPVLLQISPVKDSSS